MKIETKKVVGKDVVVVKFIEGSLSKFVDKDGVKELCVGFGTTSALLKTQFTSPQSSPKTGEGVIQQAPTLSRRKTVLFLRKIISIAKQNKIKSFAISWSEVRALVTEDISDVALGEILAIAFVMADFEFVVYKKKPADGFAFVETVYINDVSTEAVVGIKRGEIIGAEINSCRSLANMPGGDMTPKKLAAAAKASAKNTDITVKVLGEKEMEKLGMGAVLGIGRGSNEESQFIIMEYKGTATTALSQKEKGQTKNIKNNKQQPLVLIGKGVTFDSGGISLKPGDGMDEMRMDMSGGAAVIHAVVLAAKLKLSTPVVGLIPAVENMPSGSATRPGDILKSMSGRTIEILNTDAEGRVILADAITYAKKYNPRAVVECSTLTGASLVALGMQASALMTCGDEEFILKLMRLGEESGDYVWPLPLWEEYEVGVKGTFGDVANISTAGNSRYGGAIMGGMFLHEFAKDLSCPFVHLDIAPRMTSTPTEFLAKGAAGAPVRLLLAIAECGL